MLRFGSGNPIDIDAVTLRIFEDVEILEGLASHSIHRFGSFGWVGACACRVVLARLLGGPFWMEPGTSVWIPMIPAAWLNLI